jgi:hypothetical protein
MIQEQEIYVNGKQFYYYKKEKRFVLHKFQISKTLLFGFHYSITLKISLKRNNKHKELFSKVFEKKYLKRV